MEVPGRGFGRSTIITTIRKKTLLGVGIALLVMTALLAACAEFLLLKTGSLAIFLAASLLVAGGAGFAVLRIIDRLILERLARLDASVRAIGKLREISARVTMPGTDELSSLATSVNGMLDALAAGQKQLRAQESLKKSEARYRGLVDNLPEGIYLFREGRCLFTNPAGARLLGESDPEEVVGRRLTEMVPESERPAVDEQIRLASAGEKLTRLEAKLQRNDGELPVDLSFGMVTFENKPAVQMAAHDLSRLKEAENRIDYLAYHDALTGLPNLVLLGDLLTREMARAKRNDELIAVLHVDVNRFKEINDTAGFTVGDHALQAIARTLTDVLRETDVVARLSADKFVLFLPGIKDATSTEDTCRRILDRFQRPFQVDGHELYITPSIGIALYPSDGDSVDSLLKHAEIAMDRAKTQEIGYQFFSAEMVERVAERKAIENDLRKAIDRKEFVIFYQPEFEFASGRLVGAEALLRWRHPERGLVPPMSFIPLAEETGLIVPISQWVMREAARQNMAWQNAGHAPIRVAVNISARMFERPDFIDNVTEALADTGLPPEYFEAEVTETMAMKDFDTTISILGRLHKLRVPIAIDDFGTGHSSLSYLKKFPAHMLKVDRSFVKDMTPDSDDAAIAQAIIAMAHSLKMHAIAEGVETLEQLELLRSFGCDEVQGFFFSKPLPPDEFERFLIEQPQYKKYDFSRPF
ncbi:MAG TPA: EAL domain-containing protein [Candidatus Deferrimicrobiaceae bacterium]